MAVQVTTDNLEWSTEAVSPPGNTLSTAEGDELTGEAHHNALVAEAQVLNIMYWVIGGVGLAGNGLVIVVILNHTLMRRQLTNTYIINQSCVDAAASVFLILTTCFQDDGRPLSATSLADRVYCVWWLTKSPLWSVMLASSLNLIATTVERYVAVVHPLGYKTAYSTRKVLASIGLVWILGPILNFIYSAPSTAIINGVCHVFGVWPSLLANRASGIYLITMQFLLPAVMFGYCYAKMAVVLRKRLKTDNNGQSAGGEVDSQLSRARRNIIKTLAIVNTSFIICWGVNQIYFFMFNVGYPVDFQSAFYHFTVILVYMNCCINPFIYLAKYEQFQRAAKRLLWCKTAAVVGPEATVYSTATPQ